MGISSSVANPQELSEFRKLNDGSDNLEIPARPESRTVTDKKGFIIFGVVMLVFLPFLIYTLVKSDIRRLSYGSDSCGNFCGSKNSKIDGISCSGQDYTNKRYESINLLTGKRSCVEECHPGFERGDQGCYDYQSNLKVSVNITTDTIEAWKYTQSSGWKFIIVVIVAISLTVATLVLIRYAPGVMVWGALVLGLLVAIAITCLLWYGFYYYESVRGLFVILGFTSGVFTIVIMILFAVLFKKIRLIIVLYEETAKAMFSMPVLTVLPLITTFIQSLVLVLVCITTTWMLSAANLKKISENTYEYERNGVMIFSIILNLIIACWILQFFVSCQYMVTAGSVASWYFTKNRQYSPIWTSFTNTMKFHLGTLAFGSFILTLVAVVKIIIKSLISNNKLRQLVLCCCSNMEALLLFLSKNSYIETAIHGQSFFRSGKRAAKILMANASSVIAVNSVGNFVLIITQFVLLAVTTGISYALFSDSVHGWLSTVIGFLINLVVILVVFAVFETTIDTLFICFCEDKLINDGMSKPYCMTKGLMQFVENSKKVYEKRD